MFSGASVKGAYIGDGTIAMSPGARTVLQATFNPTTPPGTHTTQSLSICQPVLLFVFSMNVSVKL